MDDVVSVGWQDWNPRNYLNTFFSEVGPDTYETLNFVICELRNYLKNKQVGRILDFGCGPIPIVSIAAEPFAKEIHFADFLQSNLNEIQAWIDAKNDAFNWSKCIKTIFEIEGFFNPTNDQIKARENNLRTKCRLMRCDASKSLPLFERQEPYEIVLSIFCADSATSSKEEWRRYMTNIFSLVAPGGLIIIAALRNCKSYNAGSSHFPSANINENDLSEIISLNSFLDQETKVVVCPTPQCKNDGFESIIFARSIKKG